jgi:hypothetical protein
MHIGTYRIQPEQFSRHMKTRHLLTPVFFQYAGFQETTSDSIQRLKLCSRAMQVTAALNFPLVDDHLAQRLHFLVIQSNGQA